MTPTRSSSSADAPHDVSRPTYPYTTLLMLVTNYISIYLEVEEARSREDFELPHACHELYIHIPLDFERMLSISSFLLRSSSRECRSSLGGGQSSVEQATFASAST